MASAAGCSCPVHIDDDRLRRTGGPKPEYKHPPSRKSRAAAESLVRYGGGLRAELITVLEQKLPGISWSAKEQAYLTKLKDGTCILGTETMLSSF
ncbi:hypothetical protein AB0280_17035 [Pseudarthrobacter sp902506025]|uniref:hypothetical protein n=1 Tax=Pseudarthrobacter sp. 902506025 TaxID=3155291 RepID=UPI00344E2BFC